MKILVVEDQVVLADHLTDSLSELGYECLEPALNYDAAIHTIQNEMPNFVILDINLGSGKSGIEVGKFLSEMGIPFIYLTAYSDSSTLEMARQTNPCGYLIKPYKKSDLKPSIEIAINNFNLRGQLTNQEDSSQFDLLTDMELVIICHIMDEMSTREIAEHLSLSISTIKNHRHNICRKLGLESRNNALLSWVLINRDKLEKIKDQSGHK